jgi:dTDP-glucose 4,6-dehydratase/UDP-glucose 4-epimerase
MDLLIIGCNGFIGGHLARYFNDNGFCVFGCDIQDSAPSYIKYFKTNQQNEGLEGFLLNQRVGYCINAAGSGNVNFSIQNPIADFGSNTLGTIRVLDALRGFAPMCKYLHISSAAVYGNPKILPVSEDCPTKPISPYGFHKWMSELICQEYYQIYSIPSAIIRLFSIYGTSQKKLLLYDICSKLKLENQIQLFGTGNESRDYIHITDFAKLLHCIIKSDKFNCEIFNAASGCEITIKEVAEIFEKYYDNKKVISFSGEVRKGDPLHWRSDVQKINSIGFRPSVNFAHGIYEYINWFKTIS